MVTIVSLLDLVETLLNRRKNKLLLAANRPCLPNNSKATGSSYSTNSAKAGSAKIWKMNCASGSGLARLMERNGQAHIRRKGGAMMIERTMPDRSPRCRQT